MENLSVYKDKEILVRCDCGCSFLDFVYYSDENEMIISHYESSFYAQQQPVWTVIKNRIRRIWNALLGKEYRFYEIVLYGEGFKKFKNDMKDFIKSDRK